MSIAVVQQAVGPSAQGSGATLAASAISTTPGNAIAVFVRSGSTGVTGLTISNTGGDSFFSLGSASQGGIGDNQWFYALNINGNAADVIQANWGGGAVSFRSIHVYEISGIATAGAADQGPAANNNGSSPSVSASFTTAAADEIILTGITVGALGVTYTAGGIGGSGATLGTTIADGDAATEYQVVSSIQTGVTSSISGAGGLVSILTLKGGSPPVDGEITLGASLEVVPTGIATSQPSIALGASLEVVPTGIATSRPSIALGASAGTTDTGIVTASGAIALGASAGIAAVSVVDVVELLTLAAAGLDMSISRFLDDSVSIGVAGAIAFVAALAGNHPEVFTPATEVGTPAGFKPASTTGTPGQFRESTEDGTPGIFKP